MELCIRGVTRLQRRWRQKVQARLEAAEEAAQEKQLADALAYVSAQELGSMPPWIPPPGRAPEDALQPVTWQKKESNGTPPPGSKHLIPPASTSQMEKLTIDMLHRLRLESFARERIRRLRRIASLKEAARAAEAIADKERCLAEHQAREEQRRCQELEEARRKTLRATTRSRRKREAAKKLQQEEHRRQEADQAMQEVERNELTKKRTREVQRRKCQAVIQRSQQRRAQQQFQQLAFALQRESVLQLKAVQGLLRAQVRVNNALINSSVHGTSGGSFKSRLASAVGWARGRRGMTGRAASAAPSTVEFPDDFECMEEDDLQAVCMRM